MQLHPEASPKAIKVFTTLEKRLLDIHNNKYSYFFVKYLKSTNKVDIACPLHGIFKQSIDKHLQGRGCPICANKARGDCKRSSTKLFIDRALKIHGNKYDYSQTSYGSVANDLLSIKCKTHGLFKQSANSHLSGHGCDKCADITRRRKYLDEPTILYYLYFPNKNVYKIGITVERRGIKHRYCADTEIYEILFSKVYSTGELAYNKEQEILQNYQQYKYNGPDILIGGNSELFTQDILKEQYDKNEQYFKDEDNW